MFRFKTFQREDLARSLMHDGCILAWHMGLGKTIAAFAWSILRGVPRALIVAPGSLHEQLIKEGRDKFHVTVRPIESAADFYRYRLHLPAQRREGQVLPDFYIITYENLGYNGGDEWEDCDNTVILNRRHASEAWQTHVRKVIASLPKAPCKAWPEDAQERYAKLQRLAADAAAQPGEVATALAFIARLIEEHGEPLPQLNTRDAVLRSECDRNDLDTLANLRVGHVKNGIRCVWSPTLATLMQDSFEAVVVDEGVRVKGDYTYIATGVRRMNPRYRLVLTGTAIKNRLPDIFWLCHWAAGGYEAPTARWPYAGTVAAKEDFSDAHLYLERNLTKEDKAEEAGRARPRAKRTATIANIHRLWKLFGPIIIRRRKSDCGEALVPKTYQPVQVPMGHAQKAIYEFHLRNRPIASKSGSKDGAYKPLDPGAAIAVQLGNLRLAALAPSAGALAEVITREPGERRSWTNLTPKMVACLNIIKERISEGEAVLVMSPFHAFSDALAARLREAGVSHDVLDGRVGPRERGRRAAAFKQHRYAVLIAGIASMSEGHSFEHCPNLIMPSLSWAMDQNMQAEDRVHRLTSTKPVRIFVISTENSVDDVLASGYREKDDASSLALDGRLFAGEVEEVNPAQILQNALLAYREDVKTIDERQLEKQWETALAKELRIADLRFKEWHPPIAPLEGTQLGGRSENVSPAEVAAAMADAQPEPHKPATPYDDALSILRDLGI